MSLKFHRKFESNFSEDLRVDGATVRDRETGTPKGHLHVPRGAFEEASKPSNLKLQLLLKATLGASAHVEATFKLGNIAGALATAGAAASILNLAVTAAGFAIVIRRLNALDAKLDSLHSKLDEATREVKAVAAAIERRSKAEWIATLKSCESAFHDSSPDGQRAIWRQAADKLYVPLVELLLELRGDDGRGTAATNLARAAWLSPTIDDEHVLALLETAGLLITSRFELLLLANEPMTARDFAKQVEGDIAALKLSELEFVKARRGRAPLTREQSTELLDKVRGILELLEFMKVQARDRVALCDTLVARGISGRELVAERRSYEGNDVLLLEAP